MKFARILAPVDFSENARKVVGEAAELAREQGAELTLMHVHPIEAVAFMDFSYVEPPEKLARVCEQAEQKMRDWCDELEIPAEKCQVRVLTGNPVSEILKEAKEHNLVVMGTHGRTGVKHFLMGSVAERIVQGAECSVLIVRP